jgi:hypothetical protein
MYQIFHLNGNPPNATNIFSDSLQLDALKIKYEGLRKFHQISSASL